MPPKTVQAAKQPHWPAVWFAGVCDTLLMRIKMWAAKYESGEIYATRAFLTKSMEHVDVPVQYVHTVPFSMAEMTHLVKVLRMERPQERLTEDFLRLLSIMENPLRVRKVPKMITFQGGMFLIRLMLEKSELVSLVELLTAVKEGRSGQIAAGSGMDSHLANQKTAGKGMWQA